MNLNINRVKIFATIPIKNKVHPYGEPAIDIILLLDKNIFH